MKALHAVIFLSLLGAFAHQTVGAALATLGVLLVLPPAAGLLTLAWVARGDSSDLVRVMALRAACAVAVAVPLLALPGALLGWVGFASLVCGAALANARALTCCARV